KSNIQHFQRINCDQIICQEEILGKFLNIILLLPDLFPAYNELISMKGNEIYRLKHINNYLGKSFEETMRMLKDQRDALLVGIIRQNKTMLNPKFSETIQKNDILLAISETFIE
ncbi:MAG: hypothetical protein ACFFD2_25640, partial [Promethearchaeota archaeon]